MVKYVKCPRCELNYIDEEKQEYCDVCLAEMYGNKLQFADLDDDEFADLDDELEATEICPICGVNRMRYGDKMCEMCKVESDYDEDSESDIEDEVDIDTDEEWKNYLDDEDTGDLTVDDDTLQEELDAELDDDEDDELEDDFFDDDLGSLDDYDDDDDDDYDDDDDDDDDF